jgi:poly(A) polymerase
MPRPRCRTAASCLAARASLRVPTHPESRIPVPRWIESGPVARVLQALPGARVVGGAVRDLVAGYPPGHRIGDVDIASPLPPQDAAERLRQAGIKVVPTGLAHGTITAVAGGTPIEVTTLRRDVESFGRHATVAFDADWQTDAARRDFTINAMSLAPDGTLYDFFGGRADLLAGRVRFVGEAAARIAEDVLRALRWFRFHARYGKGQPDQAALLAIADAAPRLSGLSAERTWSELKRILAAPDPVGSLALMQRTGVAAVLLPEGFDVAGLGRLGVIGAPADPLLRLAALLPAGADIRPIAERLKLSGAESVTLAALRASPAPTPELDEAQLRRMLAETSAGVLAGRTWLAQPGAPDSRWDRLRSRLAAMPAPRFPLRAADLGLPEGPRVGRVLSAMRALWLESGCSLDRAALAAEAARRIEDGLL